ncbi:MAG: hypothetical protein FWG35_01160 [Spirochaetaceae bacterium]|nr:hypothetical protein [Spirochaetaceae bacterium]
MENIDSAQKNSLLDILMDSMPKMPEAPAAEVPVAPAPETVRIEGDKIDLLA